MDHLFRKPRRSFAALAAFAMIFVTCPAFAEPGFTGMQIQGINSTIAKALGLAKAEGILVMNVALGGPAGQAGFRRGDIIAGFQGNRVDTVKRLVGMLTRTKPGQTVEVQIDRLGKKQNLKLALGAKPESWKVSKGAVVAFPAIGITLASITQKIRKRFNLRWESVGVLVTLIAPELASRMLLERGDIIVQVNRRNVWRPDQVMKAYNKAKAAKIPQMLMLIERPDGFRYMMLPVK